MILYMCYATIYSKGLISIHNCVASQKWDFNFFFDNSEEDSYDIWASHLG